MTFRSAQDVVDFVRKETKRVMDADMRDEKRKLELYDRVSRHTGPFDHSEMDLKGMAAYAAKNLAIELQDGDDPVSAVVGYLKGRQRDIGGWGTGGAQDSAAGGSLMDRFQRLRDKSA